MTSFQEDDDYRRADERIRQFERDGAPPDQRTDIDTASLMQRFPTLAGTTVDDIELSGPHGPIPARTYRATHPEAGLVWVHGGGFVEGDLDMPESHWVSLVLAAAGISVVALDYRKALNGIHHPVPSDDVFAGWRAVRRDAGELGLPAESLHLAGASAGANLVAGVALRLRDGDLQAELPSSLGLIYPILHPELPEPDPALAAALAELPPEAHIAPGFARRVNENLVGPKGDRADPVAFPALARLEGLPRLLVINADVDDLRPSGEDFAKRAHEAGVATEVEMEPGSLHGYLNNPGSEEAERTLARLADWVKATAAP